MAFMNYSIGSSYWNPTHKACMNDWHNHAAEHSLLVNKFHTDGGISRTDHWRQQLQQVHFPRSKQLVALATAVECTAVADRWGDSVDHEQCSTHRPTWEQEQLSH